MDEPVRTNEEATDQAAPPSDTILNNPQLFSLFMAVIDERVGRRIRERNESFRNWLIGILTVIVIIITATGGLVFEYIAERAIKPAVDRLASSGQFDSAVAALNVRALGIEMKRGFSSEDANSIITEIRLLYKDQSGVEERNKLKYAVETVAESFAAANLSDLVSRLEQAAPDIFRESATATSAMLQILGFSLLSDAGAPRVWRESKGILSKEYENYVKYASKARRIGYPELYLVFEMLLRHLEGQPRKEIEGLVADADNLNETDANAFARIMLSLAANDFTRTADAASGRAAFRVKEFLCEFEDTGRLIAEVSVEVNLQC